MKYIVRVLDRVSAWMDNVSGLTLVVMMLLVVTDVTLRIFGRPIIGTYEIITLACAPLVAFAIPQTSLENGHVVVDFLIQGRSKLIKDILFVFGKTLGVALFLLIAYYIYRKGNRLYLKGDITDARHIPLYPVAYMLSFCCVMESFTLLVQIFKRFQGEAKHG